MAYKRKLSSIGIHKNVKDIPLSAQGGDDIRVRLYAESNIWDLRTKKKCFKGMAGNKKQVLVI
ncbi:MAG: hypothetical protein HFG34_07945 [Eubacterium sp.]|nr:hypothetical protein [Eubacterium sp.]